MDVYITVLLPEPAMDMDVPEADEPEAEVVLEPVADAEEETAAG